MAHKTVVFLVTLYAIIALAGCGGGGGGGSSVPTDPNAVASVTATASKGLALADNSDSALITATVTRNAGGPVADGTPITFAASGGNATVFEAASTTTSGTATAKVRRPAVTSGTNETVAVTATAGSVTSAPVSVKFINKPDTATVQVALNTAVSNLGVLVFDLPPGTGATFSTVKGINEAATSNYVGFINPAVPSNTFTVLNASGINVAANRPILEFTYAVGQITALPVFQVTGNVTATTAAGSTIPLAPSNFVVTTKFNTE